MAARTSVAVGNLFRGQVQQDVAGLFDVRGMHVLGWVLAELGYLPGFERVDVTIVKGLCNYRFEHEQPRKRDQLAALTDLEVGGAVKPLGDSPEACVGESVTGEHLDNEVHQARLQAVAGADQVEGLDFETLAVQLPCFPIPHALILIEQDFDS
ncbi:hypothetical protein [Rhodococcus sp. ARC_M6]|uniref:hypothetical protein n=1 Tax=Rhodococcus sp. ARC_M6 TaxID=2928852 RepID=UPI001FB22F16|nr:hypothetical protein [Rhodococcus sp. ARC_M6]MCJ0903965.1 hypothetical protein [Rhodococcus sp. ARC_M6]